MIDLQKIGDAVSCRAKHVNDDGQTSAEYVFDSLTTQEIPYFNLYSFNTNTRELNKLDYFAFDNDKLIKRWEYGTATETYSSMAWNPNTQLLYKISRNWVNSETMETVFEEINIKDWQIEPARRIIELTGDGYNGDTLSSTYGMTYDTANNVLILAGNAGCYQITTSGVITNLSNEPIRGLAYTDFSETPIIYCGFTNTDQLAVLDPSDGTTSGGQSITLTDYIVNSTISLCALDGTLYAILNTNQDETSKLTFVNINPSNGVATFIADFTDFAFEELTAMQKINPLDLNEYKLIARTSFFGVPENKKTVTLYVINTSGVVQNELIRFSDDRESVQNPSMTFCSADSCIYKLTTKQLPEYQSGETAPERTIFEKININTRKVTQIPIVGIRTDPGYGSINDGGDDMYDTGNIISTNIGSSVIYTHTLQNHDEDHGIESNSYSFASDGTISDGINWFGSESSYFTNMYDKLFVLCASNTSNSSFFIEGQLGADSYGHAVGGNFSLTVNSQQFTVYYKYVNDTMVSGEGFSAADPSVNHLIIIPGNGSGVNHTWSTDTNDDQDILSDLPNCTTISYLLFAKFIPEVSITSLIDKTPTLSEAQSIATQYLEILTTSSDLPTLLTNLNANYTNITDEIVDAYSFSDYSEDLYPGGFGNITGITYVENNPLEGIDFYVMGTNGFFRLSSNGSISYLGSTNSWITFTCTGISYVRDNLWATDDVTPFVQRLSKENGNTLNWSDETKVDTIIDFPNDGIAGSVGVGPYFYNICLSEGKILCTTLMDGQNNGLTIPQGNINSDYRGLTAELIPAEKYLLALGGLEAEKPSTIFYSGTTQVAHQCIPKYQNENLTIAIADNYILKISTTDADLVWVERINIDTQEKTGINISGNTNYWTNIQGAVYIGDGTFMVSSQSGFTKLTTNGELTALNGGINLINLAYSGTSVFYGINGNKLYCIDKTTGTIVLFNEEFDYATMTVANCTIVDSFAFVYSNSVFYVVLQLTGDSSGIFWCSLDVTTGIATVIDFCQKFTCAADNDGAGIYGYLKESNAYLSKMIYQINSTGGLVSDFRAIGSTLVESNTHMTWNNNEYKIIRISERTSDNNDNALTPFSMQSIDLNLNANKTIVFSGDVPYSATGFTYFENSNFYYVVAGESHSDLYVGQPVEGTTSFTNEGTITLNETPILVNSIVFDQALVLHGITDDKLITIDQVTKIATEVCTITNVGHTLTNIRALVYLTETDSFSAVASIDGTDYRITFSTNGVATSTGGSLATNDIRSLVMAPAPTITEPLVPENINIYFYDFDGSGHLSIRASVPSIDIDKLEGQYLPYSNLTGNESDDDWLPMVLLELWNDESNHYVKTNILNQRFSNEQNLNTVDENLIMRIRYRNPNSTWTYVAGD